MEQSGHQSLSQVSSTSMGSGLGNKLVCHWINGAIKCGREFTNGADLFHHLTETHIGRKATGNLNLTCCWNNCGHATEKRDHIVSHARVHVPSYKPHACKQCDKAFSRAQDLKKHMKIHAKSPDTVKKVNPAVPPALTFLRQGNYLPVYNPYDQMRPFSRSAPVSPAVPGNGYMNAFSPIQPMMYPMTARLPSAGPQSPDGSLKRTREKASPQSSLEARRESISYVASNLQNSTSFESTSHTNEQNSNNHVDMLNDFFGSIKRKKLSPEYNQEMAQKLSAIAEIVMKPGALPIETRQAEASAIEVISGEDDFLQSYLEDRKALHALATNVQNPNEASELNNFLSQLYDSVKNSNTSQLEPLAEETTDFNETMNFITEPGAESEAKPVQKPVENIAKEDISKRKVDFQTSLSERMNFDTADFDMFYPLTSVPFVENEHVVHTMNSLSEDEMDKYFSKQEASKLPSKVPISNKPNKDLRIELLRKGMEKVSLQTHAVAACASPKKPPMIHRNKNGRYPAYSMNPSENMQKKQAEFMLSDPAAIVRMVNKDRNSNESKETKLKENKTSQLERLKSSSLARASPAPSNASQRRFSHSPESKTINKTLVRSQSQPVCSGVKQWTNKDTKDFHGRLISVMMKQLEILWHDLKGHQVQQELKQ